LFFFFPFPTHTDEYDAAAGLIEGQSETTSSVEVGIPTKEETYQSGSAKNEKSW
jgi:hypothetical protein